MNPLERKVMQELYDALKEAVSEECSNHACDPCSYSNEGHTACSNKPGKCFVQRWINLLTEVKKGGLVK